MRTAMKIALKGTCMITIAASVFFTACDTPPKHDTDNTTVTPVDTVPKQPAAPGDSASSLSPDSAKK